MMHFFVGGDKMLGCMVLILLATNARTFETRDFVGQQNA
jgi:hypothetical protein